MSMFKSPKASDPIPPPAAPATLASSAVQDAQAQARANAAIAAGGAGFNSTYLSQGSSRGNTIKQKLGD